MPRTRKDEAPTSVDEPMIEGRYVELDEFTVSFETFPVAMDPSPMFAGLPDDRCQCPHWGYVVKGSFSANYRRWRGDVPRRRRLLPAPRPSARARRRCGSHRVQSDQGTAGTMAVVGVNPAAGVRAR